MKILFGLLWFAGIYMLLSMFMGAIVGGIAGGDDSDEATDSFFSRYWGILFL